MNSPLERVEPWDMRHRGTNRMRSEAVDTRPFAARNSGDGEGARAGRSDAFNEADRLTDATADLRPT